MEEKSQCFDCKYYINSFGEKGYCKFYRHETMLPEEACMKYEQIQTVERPEPVVIHTEEREDKRLRIFKNPFLVSGAISCLVLTGILLLMALYLCITVVGFSEITIFQKVLTIFLSAVAVLVFSYLLFFFWKRYIGARFFELAAAITTVIYVLVNHDTVWFSFTNLTVNIIEMIFNSIS